MPDCLVLCGGAQPRRGTTDKLLRLDVDGHGEDRVNLRLDELCASLVADIPDILTDLLEVAAYVYCADQFTTRGPEAVDVTGGHWRRRFRFRIPVRQPAIWKSAAVGDLLVETLQFLTEDEFSFEFLQRSSAPGIQQYLGLDDPEAQTVIPDSVILFSGGLDSLAGAAAELSAGRRVVLVSHQSSPMITSKQVALVGALSARARPDCLFRVPVSVNKGTQRAVEYTQRSRSFLFAALGLVVAQMFRTNVVKFYENGIVSLNLPVAENVVGSHATRTTHPRFLGQCSTFFSELLSRPVRLENPFFWKTKADVVQVLADCAAADLIPEAFSCTRVREATSTQKHCGVCSQCVDRRFAVAAAKLGAYEPPAVYATDLFNGPIPGADALPMIVSYARRAHFLAAASEHSFLASYGHVFRALRYLPGPPHEAARQVFELHRRHGQQVVGVIDGLLKQSASLDQALGLADTSLLMMLVAPAGKRPPLVDTDAEPSEVATPPHPARQPILMAIDAAKRAAMFVGGIASKAASYELLRLLAEQPVRAGNERPFLRVRKLAELLGKEEVTVRKRISRLRKDLARDFDRKLNLYLDDDDVIENAGGDGYRLNPHIVLVEPAQLGAMSQPDQWNVTSR